TVAEAPAKEPKPKETTPEAPKPELPKPEVAPSKPPAKAPIHRWSFDGIGGDGTTLTDSIGGAHGRVHAPKEGARLNDQGQL
ncbi:unnamed protein product, partial [marine sediment metagenome]